MAFRFRSNLYHGLTRKMVDPCKMVDASYDVELGDIIKGSEPEELQEACSLAGITVKQLLKDPIVSCHAVDFGKRKIFFFRRLHIEYFLVPKK